jgi:hypothetical protein
MVSREKWKEIRETGQEKGMQEPHVEGVANHKGGKWTEVNG